MKPHPVYVQPRSHPRTHKKPLYTIIPHYSPKSGPGRELDGCVVHLICSTSLKEQSDIICFLMPETNFLIYIDLLYIVYGRQIAPSGSDRSSDKLQFKQMEFPFQ